MDDSAKSGVVVAAGILVDHEGRALVAQRPDDAEQGGWWEFPGGKMHPGESPFDGLVRELDEELGISVKSASPLVEYVHEYPDRIVHLHFLRVTEYTGKPMGREGQPLRWVEIPELMDNGLLPADRPAVEVLQQIISSKLTS